MNKVILIGNLSKDVEKRQTQNGNVVANFSIAVSRTFSDETDFFNITVWGNQAENCAKYLKKGSKVGIVGALQNRSYEANDGTKRTKNTSVTPASNPNLYHGAYDNLRLLDLIAIIIPMSCVISVIAAHDINSIAPEVFSTIIEYGKSSSKNSALKTTNIKYVISHPKYSAK
jgi:hypothetical protein